jgi:hypothetical protein
MHDLHQVGHRLLNPVAGGDVPLHARREQTFGRTAGMKAPAVSKFNALNFPKATVPTLPGTTKSPDRMKSARRCQRRALFIRIFTQDAQTLVQLKAPAE